MLAKESMPTEAQVLRENTVSSEISLSGQNEIEEAIDRQNPKGVGAEEEKKISTQLHKHLY